MGAVTCVHDGQTKSIRPVVCAWCISRNRKYSTAMLVSARHPNPIDWRVWSWILEYQLWVKICTHLLQMWIALSPSAISIELLCHWLPFYVVGEGVNQGNHVMSGWRRTVCYYFMHALLSLISITFSWSPETSALTVHAQKCSQHSKQWVDWKVLNLTLAYTIPALIFFVIY